MNNLKTKLLIIATMILSISSIIYAGSATVTLNNSSGKDLYFTIKSNSTAPGMKGAYLNFSTNTWSVPPVPGGNPDYTNYNIKVSTTTSFTYPEFPTKVNKKGTGGARMFISPDSPIYNSPPTADTTILYDKIEMGGKEAIWNTTNVDFIGFPMQLTNTTSGVAVGYNDTVTRENLFNLLSNLSDYSLPVEDNEGNPKKVLRYNSPQHGVASNTNTPFQGSLTTAISNTVSTFESNYKKTKPENGKDYIYYGNYYFWNFKAVEGVPAELSASCKYLISGAPFQVTLTKISTDTVVACNIPYTPNSTAKPTETSGAAVFAALIAAAINRGVGASPDTWGVWITPIVGGLKGIPIDYYKPNDNNTGQFNKYAKALHDYSKDGKCYALAYDDYFTQDSAITVKSGDSVNIKVLPFTGGGSPTAYSYPTAPATNPLPDINPPATYKYTLNLGIPPIDYPFTSHGYLYANGKEITVAEAKKGANVPTNEENVSIKFSETNVSFTVNAKTGVISNKIPTTGFPSGITTVAMPPKAIGAYNLVFSADF